MKSEDRSWIQTFKVESIKQGPRLSHCWITAIHVVNLSIKIPLEKKDITEAILDESIPIEKNPANSEAIDNIFLEFDPHPNPKKTKKVREKEISDAKLLEQSQLKMLGTLV
ncbi:unnamed protein product [Ambrosiozyma monospora]|uniref:Unnamed protein product n=1 Tax=Ambrosiozyma monospora TaxID=43982 RepID=A0A9W6YTR6_AMBMO|nr:unnamed protein product [Ambrosiozyma monospora]